MPAPICSETFLANPIGSRFAATSRATSSPRHLRFFEDEVPSAEFDIVQAATWILTDDATFELRSRPAHNPFANGFRMINKTDALRAMRAIHSAGIDLSTRCIWQDREELREGIDGADLTTWMDEVANPKTGGESDPP